MRTYSIVGMNYIKTEGVVAALAVGTAVTLVREPQNVHDKNAVAVYVGIQRVGYIPKKQNLVLAAFIDQQPLRSMAFDAGTGFTANVRAVDAKFVRSPNSGYPMVEV
jgi:hypothetical protein